MTDTTFGSGTQQFDLRAEWQALAAPLGRRLDPERHAALEHYFNQKAGQVGEPVLMLYGLYNAGKSTLVNILVGRECAAVGDVPTTDSVQRHAAHGYTLLDTPGIDAPIEHERVTEAQLEVTDLVMMVVDGETAAHERATYDNLLDLHARGKRLLIVVNLREWDMDGGRQRAETADAIYTRVQRAAERRGVPAPPLQELPICQLNAAAAWQGRQQGDERLLALSGFSQLNDSIEELVAGCDTQTERRARVGALLVAVEDALAVGHREGSALEELRRMQGRLEDTRDSAQLRLMREVRRQRQQLERQCIQLMSRASEGDEPLDANELEMALEQQLGSAEAHLLEALEHELHQTAQLLGQELRASCILNGMDLETRLAVEVVSADAAVADEDRTHGASHESLSDLSMLVHQLDRDAIVSLLKTVKRVMPKLMKGIGPVTMERMAETWLNGIRAGGPLVSGAVEVIYSHYEQRKAREKLAQQQAALERFHQAVRNSAQQIGQGYQIAAAGLLERAFDEALRPLQQALEAQREALDADANEVAQLGHARRRLAQWLAHASVAADPVGELDAA